MERRNIYITKKQDEELNSLATMLKIPRADIVRNAIDDKMSEYRKEIDDFVSDISYPDDTYQDLFRRKYEYHPVDFIEDCLKIISKDQGMIPFNLWDVQKKLVDIVHDYNEVILNKSRQCGASITMLAYIAHYIIFNRNKYIFLGSGNLKMGQEMLRKLYMLIDNLPTHIKPNITNKTKTGFVCNGNHIYSKSVHFEATNSVRFDFVYVDEFSLVNRKVADDFFDCIYPMLASSDTPYKLIITSTPNDCNHFYALWANALANYNNLKPVKIPWTSIPGRDNAWKEDLITHIGKERFESEFECKFTKEGTVAI